MVTQHQLKTVFATIWLVLALVLPAHAIDVKAVQCILPTVDGNTTDCVSSGFGAIQGAIVVGTNGTANGTPVTHTMWSIGFYDGTRQSSIGGSAEDGQGPTDTGSFRDTDSVYNSQLISPSQAKDGDCTASVITDGIRLTCADAPPAAYRVNVLLLGGTGISNAYTNTAIGNATQNGTTNVTAPGFQSTCVLIIAHNQNAANLTPSVGAACKKSGVITQRGLGFNNSNNSANANVASILSTTRTMIAPIAASPSLEVTDIHATGFEVTTRDAGGARDFAYMAIQTSGIDHFLGTIQSPAGTGSQGVTGVGFLPQGGLMLWGEFAATDTLYGTDNGEVMGLSFFDATDQFSASVYSEDSNGTSAEESVTQNILARGRKDGADYVTSTLTSMDSNGFTRNYTVNAGGVRQQAVLLFQSSATPSTSMMGRRNQCELCH